LRKAIESGALPSMLFWGPPGVGKTTLAYIISQSLYRPFFSLSAINSGVKDVREVIEKASVLKEQGEVLPILFIDEIHRFSKSQQDSLLGAVERGIVTLIGATTENPSFEVISALLSRCQVYILQPLVEADLLNLLDKAMKEDEVLTQKKITIKEHEALLRLSGGDARKLLNIFELMVNAFDKNHNALPMTWCSIMCSKIWRCTIKPASSIMILFRPLSNQCAAATLTAPYTGWRG
jgi:putative ATPase